MALNRSTRIDRCEVDQRTGIISVRSQSIVTDDASGSLVEVARGPYVRFVITPATPASPELTGQIAVIGDNDDRQFVRRIANAVFTPEVVAAYVASLSP